jgi:glycosyltransferase involved in cell wall biosynthesis
VKRVLIVAYHFYPNNEIGAIRSIKFARFLPDYGWKPFVLTVNAKYHELTDPSPLGFDCDISRTMKFPVTRDINLWLKSLIRRINKKTPAAYIPGKDRSTATTAAGPHIVPLWRRFEYSLNWMPDDKIGWFLPAVIRAIRLIHKHKIDIIYSSGPPWSVHVVAWGIKKLTGKKWIADFRDPWQPEIKNMQITTAMSRWISIRMKDAVIRNAAILVSIADQLKARLGEEYNQAILDKCHVIPNGYDEDDFAGIKKTARIPGQPITFLHAGSLLRGRDPTNMLLALADLLKEGRIDSRDIRVKFMGTVAIDKGRLAQLVADSGMSEVVSFEEPVARREYLKRILNADVLILINDLEVSIAIPGKTFEYMATGNRILSLITSGPTYKLLEGLPGVWSASQHDKSEIARCIWEAYADARKNDGRGYSRDTSLEKYSRRKLTGKLAELLNIVSDGSANNPLGLD